VSTTIDVLRNRVSSVCATLGWIEAQTPFDFDLQPSGAIDGVFRSEASAGSVIGGFNFSEERTDLITVWIARKNTATPNESYTTLLTDITSLRAAVIRDGHNSGEYFVPDEGSVWDLTHDDGREYAVAELTLPVNYEAVV
jgi:hypothetical protein